MTVGVLGHPVERRYQLTPPFSRFYLVHLSGEFLLDALAKADMVRTESHISQKVNALAQGKHTVVPLYPETDTLNMPMDGITNLPQFRFRFTQYDAVITIAVEMTHGIPVLQIMVQKHRQKQITQALRATQADTQPVRHQPDKIVKHGDEFLVLEHAVHAIHHKILLHTFVKLGDVELVTVPRADLFGLYYLPDQKMIELGLTPNEDAFKAEYYTYMMNGLMTQLVRIEYGHSVEEAHMRNRQLIAKWAYEKGASEKVVELVKKEEKTYVKINDYKKLRDLFGTLLAEIQRIKSEGDYEAARQLVEKYAVKVDPQLHAEVLLRYEKLHLAPYKGFINPVYEAVTDEKGRIIDVKVSYQEGYAEQMLRYSREYSNLPYLNE